MSPRPSALLSRRLPPCNGWSLSPRHCLPTRDVRLTRHQQGFIVIHPSSLPLACGPRTEQGPSGFPLGFAPRRPEPATHARAGTGLDTDPGYVFDITSNLLQRSHSSRATSCRRRRVLPSTAIAGWLPWAGRRQPVGQPGGDRGVQRVPIDRGQHAPQGGLAGDAMLAGKGITSHAERGQHQRRGVSRPLGDRGQRPGTGQDRRGRQREHAGQRVAQASTVARVGTWARRCSRSGHSTGCSDATADGCARTGRINDDAAAGTGFHQGHGLWEPHDPGNRACFFTYHINRTSRHFGGALRCEEPV